MPEEQTAELVSWVIGGQTFAIEPMERGRLVIRLDGQHISIRGERCRRTVQPSHLPKTKDIAEAVLSRFDMTISHVPCQIVWNAEQLPSAEH